MSTVSDRHRFDLMFVAISIGGCIVLVAFVGFPIYYCTNFGRLFGDIPTDCCIVSGVVFKFPTDICIDLGCFLFDFCRGVIFLCQPVLGDGLFLTGCRPIVASMLGPFSHNLFALI